MILMLIGLAVAVILASVATVIIRRTDWSGPPD